MAHDRSCIEWGAVTDRIFFEQDFDEPTSVAPFNQRILLNFYVSPIKQTEHEKLSKWMTNKWADLSADIKRSWINRIVVFFQTQTVVQGETGFSVGTKVITNIIKN